MKRLFILSAILALGLFSSCGKDDVLTKEQSAAVVANTPSHYRGVMMGDQEIPTHSSNGEGLFEATLTPSSKQLTYKLTYGAVPGTIFTPTAAHIHKGAPGVNGNAVIIFDLGQVTPSPMTGALTLTAEQITELKAGMYYVHLHSTIFPEGDIRGQIRVRQ